MGNARIPTKNEFENLFNKSLLKKDSWDLLPIILISIFLVAIAIFFGGLFIAIVPAGHIGIYNNLGVVSPDGLQPGFYLKLPWVSIIPMSIQTQEIKESSTVPSMEGLLVTLETSLIYKIDSQKVPEIYKTLGISYADVIVTPQLRSVIREVTARYEAKALYTSARQEITEQIFEDLTPRLSERGIIVESMLLRDLKLPDTVTTAIEAKLKAEQEAQQMSFVLQKEKLEAERKTIEAEGIKSAQEIIARSLTPEYLHWYWIQQISNQPNVMYIATEAGLPLFKEVGK